MSTLWLDHRDMELRGEGSAVVPYVAGRRGRPVPLKLLERVVIIGNCRLEASVLTLLASHGVSLACLSPRKTERRAWIIGPGHGDARIRIDQLHAVSDPSFKRTVAHRLIYAKVKRQLRMVVGMLAVRPDAAYPLNRARATLQNLLQVLRTETPSIEALRGLEGNASRAAFDALAAVLPSRLGFSGRKRRPPPDPANAVLSLSYTILHHRAVQVLWAHGLEPFLGFLHEPVHGRESLAADIIEPWRPVIDQWVWRLFADRILKPEHFGTSSDEGNKTTYLLGKAGRRLYYKQVESIMRPLQRAMRLQTRQLIHATRHHVMRGDELS